MRGLLFLIAAVVIYYALKALVHSAIKSHVAEDSRKRVKGEDMVLCPECRTYVVQDRAVTRSVGGSACSFCSEACASRHEQKHRN